MIFGKSLDEIQAERWEKRAARQGWRDMLTEAETLQLSAEMERRAEEIVRARSTPEALQLIDAQRL